jgi:hypothetical protein
MKQEPLTWNQLKSWWPILVGCIAITLSYAALLTRIEVLDTKLNNVVALLEKSQKDQIIIVANLNDLNKDVIALKTIHGIR